VFEVTYIATFCCWVFVALIFLAFKRAKTPAPIIKILAVLSLVVWIYIINAEFMSRRVVAPIRVDLVLLIPLFSSLYIAVGIWGLWRWRTQRAGLLLLSSLALIVIPIQPLVDFVVQMKAGAKNMSKIESIDSLLFEAQFKNEENFSKTFGSIDRAQLPIAGHYQAANGSWATRAIVNTEGHLWIYFLGRTLTDECIRTQGDLGRSSTGFPQVITLHPQVGADEEGRFTDASPDRFTISIWTDFNGQKRPYMTPVTFTRSPVPFRGATNAPSEVKYLGAFSQKRIRGNTVEPIQLWLWQAGPRFMGFYIRRNFACESQNGFISAVFLEGQEKDHEIYLTNSQSMESVRINNLSAIRIDGKAFYQGQPLEDLHLKPTGLFRSDRYDVAPLSKYEQTREWLQTVSMTHMFTWHAECTPL
jgi:hypothetical protein